MNAYRFTAGRTNGACAFELRWSKAKARPVVVVVGDEWDYDDCEDAADMSAEVRHCRSLADAAEVLGLSGPAESWFPYAGLV